MKENDKAKEIFNRYVISISSDNWRDEAKECSIICVDEVLSAIEWNGKKPNPKYDFWKSVKSEIEAL